MTQLICPLRMAALETDANEKQVVTDDHADYPTDRDRDRVDCQYEVCAWWVPEMGSCAIWAMGKHATTTEGYSSAESVTQAVWNVPRLANDPVRFLRLLENNLREEGDDDAAGWIAGIANALSVWASSRDNVR